LILTEPLAADYGKYPALAGLKIVVADMDRAIRFYSTLGMKEVALVIARPPSAAKRLEVMMRYPEERDPWLILVQAGPDSSFASGAIAMLTPDIKGLFERIQAAGYPIKRQPQQNQEHTRLIGIVDDPDGHSIEMMESVKREEVAKK
jgi:catechol 2,3-dioxygenase-like lactoylglutathione lyase family enzyme